MGVGRGLVWAGWALAGALLQLPPSRNQSLPVASEPGGGDQVNSGAPGAAAPQAPSPTGAVFFISEPRQKPPGWARVSVCAGDTSERGVSSWARAGTHPIFSESEEQVCSHGEWVTAVIQMLRG